MISKSFFYQNIITSLKRFSRQVNLDGAYLFGITLSYYMISLLNLNNKTLYLSCLLLWGAYYWRVRDLRLSLVLTGITSLIFNVGKTWEFHLIRPELLKNSEYEKGYSVFLTITPFNILIFFSLCFMIRDWFKDFKFREKFRILLKKSWFVSTTLFFLWPIAGALFSKNIYNLALLFSLQNGLFLIFLLSLIFYKVAYKQIFYLLGAMAIFESGLVVMQWLKKSTLGLVIEANQQFLSYNQTADQDFFSIRPIGTFSHANELALFGAMMVLFFLPVLYLKFKRKNRLTIIFLISAIVCLIFSLGRSAWVSVFISAFLFFYIVEKHWNQKIIFFRDLTWKHLVAIILVTTLTSLIILPRVIRGLDFFSSGGGLVSRSKLVEESWKISVKKPFFGTGKSLSVLEMLYINPEGVISIFPVPVHNFYLLIMSESGVPTLLFFILMIFLVVKKELGSFNTININGKIRTMGMVMVIIAALVNSLVNFIFLMGFLILILYLLQGQHVDQEN